MSTTFINWMIPVFVNPYGNKVCRSQWVNKEMVSHRFEQSIHTILLLWTCVFLSLLLCHTCGTHFFFFFISAAFWWFEIKEIKDRVLFVCIFLCLLCLFCWDAFFWLHCYCIHCIEKKNWLIYWLIDWRKENIWQWLWRSLCTLAGLRYSSL